MILNGVEVKRENGNVSLVNKGVVEVMSGGNRFYFDPSIPFQPGEEPRIVGINVDNQGTVRIHPNSSFGFKAEIADYVPGGATLGTGTWEVIGAVPQDPFPNDGMAFLRSGEQASKSTLRTSPTTILISVELLLATQTAMALTMVTPLKITIQSWQSARPMSC